ncbi:MAG TPA: hypothetical protein VEU33_10705 [Archangium sp.]|nr:hypothetical protein [Archangium sp.]
MAAGKRFGNVLATANFVVGRELSNPEGDVEGHLGLGYLVMENLVVGLNTRYQHEFETEKAGREFELMTAVVAGRLLHAARLQQQRAHGDAEARPQLLSWSLCARLLSCGERAG